MAEFNLRNAQLYAAQAAPVTANVRNVNMYAAVVSPPVVETRNVTAYALYTANPELSIRNVTAYALYTPLNLSYLKMKGAEALLKAINKEHGRALTTAQITFSEPAALANDHYNSTVAIIARQSFGYSGQMAFRYDRFSLDKLLGESIPLPAGSWANIHAFLATLNTAHGCNLEARDLVNDVIPAGATGFYLTVAASSYLFTPGSQVLVGFAPNDLGGEISVTNLAGFDPET